MVYMHVFFHIHTLAYAICNTIKVLLYSFFLILHILAYMYVYAIILCPLECMYMFIFICILEWMVYVCIYVCIFLHGWRCMCVSMYVYICMYVCMYLCMYAITILRVFASSAVCSVSAERPRAWLSSAASAAPRPPHSTRSAGCPPP